MTFGIGRGFAEVQSLKKNETGPISWTFCYILIKFCIPITSNMILTERLPNLAQEIAKWHLTSVEAVSSSKFWKSYNGDISWTEWNIVMKYWYDKMYPMRLSNDIWGWSNFCRGSNSEKSKTIAKWHLSSVEALPSAKFWKSENGLISWTEWNILIDFCINIVFNKI